MKGRNELVLNEDTIVEAIQEWLDKRMTVFSPRVCSVEQATGAFDAKEFTVVTESRSAVVIDVPPEAQR